MQSFSIFTLVTESANNEEKLTHLEHLEDHVINAGAAGYHHAVNNVNAVHKTLTGQKGGAKITEKFDGSPSIVFGHHPETGKFFVASKSAFNKTPKLNYTHEDIEKNHGHAPGLVSKLKTALDNLPKVAPKHGVFQGDVMHTPEDVHKTGNKLSFTPNTITYHEPASSEHGKKIAGSHIGIAVHTGYAGKDVSSLKADYTPDLSKFKEHPHVHMIDVNVDHKKVDYSPAKQEQVKSHMEKADRVARQLKPADYKSVEPHTEHIKTYINKTVRLGTTPNVDDFYDHVKEAHTKEIKKLKMPATIQAKTNKMNNQLSHIRNNSDTLSKVFELHNHLQKAKDVQTHALSTAHTFKTSISGTETKPEGYVAVVNNRPTKFVDRSEFSRQNFLKTR